MNAVIYATMSGHSKKLAKAIATELGVEARDVKENPVMKKIDVLFLVSGIYGGASTPELVEYCKQLTIEQVKKVVFITSCVTGNMRAQDIIDILTEKEIEISEDTYTCFGNFLIMKLGHPNKKEIHDAVEFVSKYK